MIAAWVSGIVTKEYPCRMGRGAAVILDKSSIFPKGREVGLAAFQIPQNFKIGDRIKTFMSWGSGMTFYNTEVKK